MTISSATSKNQYVASGSNPTFTYTFKIYSEGDIRVLSDDTVNTLSDYVVTGVGNPSGGTIVFNVNPVASTIVTLKRNEPLTQEIEYVEGDDFPAASHEEGLDRSAIRDQYLQEQIDRALLLPEFTTATSFGLADPTGNGLKLLQLNAAEDEIDYVEVVGSLDGVAIAGGDAGKPVIVNATEDGFEIGTFSTSIPDGDKGDITVSSSGTAWTIDNDAVTYAKMQNISAASRLLGRGSAGGAGDTQELTIGSNLSLIGTVLDAVASGGGVKGVQWFASSGTYTPTSGATWAIIFSQGGGGEGGTSAGGSGNAGGNTTVGSIATGNGGAGGAATGRAAGGAASNGTINLTGASGFVGFGVAGLTMGGDGGAARFLGAPGNGDPGTQATAALANSGSGGGGNGRTAPTAGSGGGAAGGLAIRLYDCTGGAQVVTIGAGGTGGGDGGDGGSGYVLVLEF